MTQLARQEGEACLLAAGIAWASDQEDLGTRRPLHPTEVVGHDRGGSSTWQRLAGPDGRGRLLNGEVVLLGRLNGVPTPSTRLQRLANQAARAHSTPGMMGPEEVLALLDLPAE